jgi:hypothetical protein
MRMRTRKMFRCIIAGGRDFEDYTLLQEKCIKVLTSKLPHVIIISGCASGGDKLGEVFAAYNNLEVERFPADWENLDVEPCVIKYNKYGKPYNAVAGHNRNRQMAERAEALIGFWDGRSKGTGDMVMTMRKLEKPVRIIRY